MWSPVIVLTVLPVVPLAGTWIEMDMVQGFMGAKPGRPPRGDVD